MECELDLELEYKSYIFGRIILWASGKPIGDFSLTVVLNIPADFFCRFLAFEGQRCDEDFDKLAPEDIVNIVYQVLYGEMEIEPQNRRQLARQYDKLCVCPGSSESFDGWFSLLLENHDGSRFIWQEGNSTVQEITLKAGEFESMLRAFLGWLSDEAFYKLPDECKTS